ncbi:MAG: hypothetical protein KBG10_07000 [Anaerolineaceae bacterium]|nr:hypothetical protein [Anaerolineaceae bacterium]
MGKENQNIMPNENEKAIELESFSSPDFNPEEISRDIARSLCEPSERLYKRDPELKKDPFKAMGEVRLVGKNESEIPDPVEGLFVGAAKLETAKKELNLTPKQKEAFNGVLENIHGAIAWAKGAAEETKDYITANKVVRKTMIGAQVVGLTLTSAGCVNVVKLSEAAFTETPVPAKTFTPTPTKTATPTEIPEGKIILNENSFIPTGEYPKDSSDFVLLSPQYIGESAKEAVIRNGLSEQAGKIEKMYQTLINNSSIWSRRVKEGYSLEFIYMVSKNNGNNYWNIMAIINNEDAFTVPKILMPARIIQNPTRAQVLNQSEILEISNTGLYPENYFLLGEATPVGFGKKANYSIFADEKGHFLLGLAEKSGTKPLVWYNAERISWQLGNNTENVTETSVLQENIDLWMNGNVSYPDEEKFSKGAEPAQFGFVEKTSDTSIYQGVLLGTQFYQDNLIVYFGFESSNNKRFYMPFDLGNKTSSLYGFDIVRPLRSDLFKGSDYDIDTALSVDAGNILLRQLEMKPIGIRGGSWSSAICYTEITADYKTLCEKQFKVTETLPGLFGLISTNGADFPKNPLINGHVGANGLELVDLPRVTNLMMRPQDEPSLDDY